MCECGLRNKIRVEGDVSDRLEWGEWEGINGKAVNRTNLGNYGISFRIYES